MHPSLLDIYEKSIAIPKYERIHDFFEAGFDLTQDDRLSRFDISYSPWIRILCDWFEDPGTEWIFMMMASQVAKTSFMMGVLLYISQHVRGAVPVLWVNSIEEEAKQFITDRLRPFLDESGEEAIKKGSWKKQAFRVYNASVKVGYATTKASLKSSPRRYVIGDEVGIWKETIEYVKKRTRTFSAKRKGIFGTTPPDDENHHSVKEMTAGNFYQFWVPCIRCGEYQGKTFKNLVWYEKSKNERWDLERVKATAGYRCAKCHAIWRDCDKMKIINAGKAKCVDFKTYEPIEERITSSKTLHVNGLYSPFTTYGQLAIDFLLAKEIGFDALKVFFTDELAEVPQDFGDSLSQHQLADLIDRTRPSGLIKGFDLYTFGIDVQRTGELYYVLMAWRSGTVISGHVLKYGIIEWLDQFGQANWNNLVVAISDFDKSVYCYVIDSSDGVVTQEVYDFCASMGPRFIPLKDTTTQSTKCHFKHIQIDPRTKQPLRHGEKLLVINSDMVKDEISTCLRRSSEEHGAWSLPADTTEIFLKHLTNEHRTGEKRRGRMVSTWKPKYSNAPQHYFSALVYATAAMEDRRVYLQKSKVAMQSAGQMPARRMRSRGRWH